MNEKLNGIKDADLRSFVTLYFYTWCLWDS